MRVRAGDAFFSVGAYGIRSPMCNSCMCVFAYSRLSQRIRMQLSCLGEFGRLELWNCSLMKQSRAARICLNRLQTARFIIPNSVFMQRKCVLLYTFGCAKCFHNIYTDIGSFSGNQAAAEIQRARMSVSPQRNLPNTPICRCMSSCFLPFLGQSRSCGCPHKQTNSLEQEDKRA